MSTKYFDNQFQDYPEQDTKSQNKLVELQSKISLGLKEKFDSTMTKLTYNVDYKDYSVYTGTSGIALLQLKNNPKDKSKLKEIIQLLCLNTLKGRRYSFLCGDAGPLAIGAVIYHKLQDQSKTDELVARLRSMQQQIMDINSDVPNEYLYGRAGYLFAILYVNTHISSKPYEREFVVKIIETIFVTGKNEARRGNFQCPLMYQWHESYYLGAAHGLTGILYLLLQARDYLSQSDLQNLIKPTIEFLVQLRFPTGNFPSSLGRDNDKYVQWCHGAPGFLYLFTTAYKVYGDPKYLQLAKDCGDVIWNRGLLRKGYSLCHGVSGNGYCFLELFQTTHEQKHLYRALKFAEWCFDYTSDHEEYPPDRPNSLYEGIAGPMYYLLDIQEPLSAKFPGFTL